MTDNRHTSARSYRNHCDISFIRDNFRFREKPPSRPDFWKLLSFFSLVVLFLLVNLKIRIHGAKLKYNKNYIDSFVHGYSKQDMRVCPVASLHQRSKSVYLLFATLSKEFHGGVRERANQAIAQEEVKPVQSGDVESDTARATPKTIKKSKESIKDILMPGFIIVLLLTLTMKAVWDVVGNNNLTKKKPSLSSVSRRPSNLLRKMSETNLSVRRPSYSRQLSQPDLKRRLSIVKEVSGTDHLTRQYSAPASYISPDCFRRGYAVDYSFDEDPTTPELKRRVRMIRRY